VQNTNNFQKGIKIVDYFFAMSVHPIKQQASKGTTSTSTLLSISFLFLVFSKYY
jgi:hypothetical protein